MEKDWTRRWTIEKIQSHSNIESIKAGDGNAVLVTRKEGESLLLWPISCKHITSDFLTQSGITDDIDFILNIPKDSVIDSSVYCSLANKKIVVGGLSDLLRIIGQHENWPYISKEAEFVLPGLQQHHKVRSVKRLDFKRYYLERYFLEPVTIIAINDYELSIESVRQAKAQYENFDIILKSNPNGGISPEAYELATSLEIKILRWGELLSQLNKP
jgi:hypothetical protein